MYTKPTTFTEYLVEEEKQKKDATGAFTLLMLHIESAAKIIASHLRKTGLVDIIGTTGKKNATDDDVKKVDVFANELFIDMLKNSGLVGYIGSEELEGAIEVNKSGRYNVFFDPIDGSTNIEVGGAVGSIFSIYRNTGEILQSGNKQVAAGYVLYGPSVILVYSCGFGVNGFTLDPSVGSFFLSHKNMQVPKRGSVYAIPENASLLWDKNTQDAITAFKKQDYKARYFGCAVADVHRALIKGGIFIYPQDSKNKNGKLRLMYEVNPMAFIVKQAGGEGISGGVDPLEIMPADIHQRTPIALGGKEDIAVYRKYCG